MLTHKRITSIRKNAFNWFMSDIESTKDGTTLELNTVKDVVQDMSVFFKSIAECDEGQLQEILGPAAPEDNDKSIPLCQVQIEPGEFIEFEFEEVDQNGGEYGGMANDVAGLEKYVKLMGWNDLCHFSRDTGASLSELLGHPFQIVGGRLYFISRDIRVRLLKTNPVTGVVSEYEE